MNLELQAYSQKVVAEKPISKAKGESAILQVSQFKRLLRVKPPREGDLEGIPVLTHPKFKELPKEFDARKAWPQCSAIGRILGQFLHLIGHCGSCWDFGAVESLSVFTMNISLSVNDVLACCGILCGQGYNGGYPISAWQYFVRKGVVTEKINFFLLDIFSPQKDMFNDA
ncbi:putative vesicle-associated membrane protein-like isoform 1 [Capsicum annuum]|uniref:Peptidase C1A papain C-terminal domain-containing protein n=1 Tax=Capsicum annuum TaxID=4072 RepID=A0A2G3A0M0_CAPAN|nr:putative vesicle-associated membrane protein-like isoform 1 [Capsicum annuum]PHT87751.1 hypothetical protein T459_09857 [Capsicum annuum]